MSYPAPDFLEDDPWFGPAFRSKKAARKYETKLFIEQRVEEIQARASKESTDIHKKMYEVATQSRSTTLHLDPAPVLGGGSDNVWQSGTGL